MHVSKHKEAHSAPTFAGKQGWDAGASPCARGNSAEKAHCL